MTDDFDEIESILEDILVHGTEGSDHITDNAGGEVDPSEVESFEPGNENGFTKKYMRFQSTTYHLTYEEMNKTFCGRELPVNYPSTSTEPELLDPCKLCHQVANALTEQEQMQKIRTRLSKKIGDIADKEDPGQFNSQELSSLLDSIPTEFSPKTTSLQEYRLQLSEGIEGIAPKTEDPGSFTKSELIALEQALEGKGVISEETELFIFTDQNNIKRIQLTQLRIQNRGGKGVTCFNLKSREQIQGLFTGTPRDTLLAISDRGRIYKFPARKVTQNPRDKEGSPINEYLRMESDETIATIIPVRRIPTEDYLTIVTKNGHIKRTKGSEFTNIHTGGIVAAKIDEEDEIRDAILTNNQSDILLGTNDGQVIRFDEQDVRSMGRTAKGVYGIDLNEGASVVGITSIQEGDNSSLFTITENGFGKKTDIAEYQRQVRNGMGLVDIDTGERNGPVVNIQTVTSSDTIMISTKDSQLIWINSNDVSSLGRNTKGVLVIDVNYNDVVADSLVM